MIVGIVIATLIVVGAGALALYVDNNKRGEARDLDRAYAAGFQEKHVDITFTTKPAGQESSLQAGDMPASTYTATVNYAEGPNNGPALILIHGQSMEWEDYARVLPELAKNYHVFAIDCFGHGESTHDPVLYTCAKQGQSVVAFAQHVVGDDYLVSGLSSGGVIAAWVAANDAPHVRACVLEDPPLFRVTPQQMQEAPGCFAWKDGFKVAHAFLNQDEVEDYAVYYAQHSYLLSLFGGLQSKIAAWTAAERAQNPDEHLTLSWVPHDWVRGMYFYDDFDPRFSEAFYQGTWLEGVNQAQMLASIACPTVYLKASTNYGEDGVLYAANTDEDAARVQELIPTCETLRIESGHDIHYEQPKAFVAAIDQAQSMCSRNCAS